MIELTHASVRSRQSGVSDNDRDEASGQPQVKGPGGVPLSRQGRPGLDEVILPVSSTVAKPAPSHLAIARRLSPERLAPYRALAGSDLAAALSLYEWNAELSGAWWSVIGDVEVLLRNAMHERLMQLSRRRFGEPCWYLDPGGLFSEEAQRAIESARWQVYRSGRAETPSRVVTELSLGFWRFLLAARYERSLWVPVLRDAFPHLKGRGMRREAHEGIHRLHGLRNRIAHHEPIHNRPLEGLHKVALRAAGWICPDTAEWIRGRSRVQGLLERKP